MSTATTDDDRAGMLTLLVTPPAQDDAAYRLVAEACATCLATMQLSDHCETAIRRTHRAAIRCIRGES